MNTNKTATGSTSKRLLAALAVLAVAIVALAAIPAAAVDSSDAEVPTSESGDAQIVLNGVGLIAPDSAGYGAQTSSSTILAALDGEETAYGYENAGNMLIVSSDFPEGTTKIVWTVTDGSFTKSESASIGASIPTLAGTHSWYDAYGSVVASFQTDADGESGTEADTDAQVPSEKQYSFDKVYTITIEATVGSDVYTKTVTWSGEGFAVYSGSVDISSLTDGYAGSVVMKEGASFTGKIGDSTNNVDLKNAVAQTDVVVSYDSTDGISIEGSLLIADVTEVQDDGTVELTKGTADVSGAFALADGAVLSADTNSTISAEEISLGKAAQVVLKADQRTPTVFTAGADGAKITSSGGIDSSLALTEGALELTSGSYEVEAGDSLIISQDTTFTVASGAALKVDDGASDDAATLTVNGTLALSSTGGLVLTGYDKDESGTTVTYSSGNTVTFVDDDTKQAVLAKAVLGYAVGDATNGTGIEEIGHDTVAYEGEEVSMIITTEGGYVVSKAGYGTTADSTFAYSTDASKDASRATYQTETWYFTMPSNAVDVYATGVGAYTATFVLIDENGDRLNKVFVSEAYNDGNVPVPPITYDGYAVGKYYLGAEMSFEVTPSNGTIEIESAQSVVIYVQMNKLYAVAYADAVGGSVSGAENAQADSPVSVTVIVDDHYQLDEASIAVTYEGGSVQVSAVSDEGVFSFVMPAADVTVSVSFDRLYALKADALDTSATTGYGTVSITKVDGTELTEAITNKSEKISEEYIAGTAVVLTVSDIADGFGISQISLVDGNGKDVLDVTSEYDADDSEYTASFLMPASDVTLAIEFGHVHTLTLNVPVNGSISAASTDGDLSTDDAESSGDAVSNNHIAEGNLITLTLTPDEDYGLVKVSYTVGTSTEEIVLTGDEDGVYSFKMPTDDATVTAVFGPLQTLDELTFTGYGYASYDKENNAVAAPGKIGFTVVPTVNDTVKYEVNKITVKTGSTTVDTYTNLGDTNTGTTVTISHVGNEYSLVFGDEVTEPTSYTVDVTFTPVVYYTVTVSSGSVDYVSLYTDAAQSEQIELDSSNQASLRSGTDIYIVVKDTEQQTNLVRASPTGNSASSITLTAAGVERVQYFNLAQNTTIYAGYEAYTFVVTIEDADNGSVKVYNGETEVSSGASVPYNTELTIVPTGDDGYDVDTVSVNGSPIEAVDGAYTTVVGLQNVTVSATFQEVYAIEVSDSENGSVVPSVSEAPADAEVTITVEADQGYVLTAGSLKATDAEGGDITLTPNDDGTYTFTMPASKVTVAASFESDPSAAASNNVRVTVTNDSENEVVVLLQSRDGGYIPSGTVTLTITFRTAAGYYDYVELTDTYTADGSATYYEITLAPSEAQLADIVAGSGVSGYATFVGGSIAPVSLTAGLSGVFVETSEEASA